MLVLSRKNQEQICIGGREIIVTVVAIVGDKVRLGITATKGVSVHRKEVQDLIDSQEAAEAAERRQAMLGRAT